MSFQGLRAHRSAVSNRSDYMDASDFKNASF